MMGERPDITATFAFYGVDITGLHGNRLVQCPAHDENRASCSVNLDKGVAQCFACDFRGDALTLIQLKEGIDFAAALAFAEANLGFTRDPSVGRSRVGLSGKPGAARGGYRPAVRRRAGLAGR